MTAKLFLHHYGKESVRVTKVRRLADCHELVEMKVDITLGGDFDRSFTHGDNSKVIATDSMKNTVYLLAKDHPLDSPESFAMHLARHFVETYHQVGSVQITIDQSSWKRIEIDGAGHPTAFESGGAELRLALAIYSRSKREMIVKGGLTDLLVLKTTDSAFTGFVRDAFTTLPEVTDRILATKVRAVWFFENDQADFNAAYDRIRSSMLRTFATHKSDAVQQTLLEMGDAALAAEPTIKRITLTLPNKHRIPFNFKPFGKEFDNDVYITTDEPSGSIFGMVERKEL